VVDYNRVYQSFREQGDGMSIAEPVVAPSENPTPPPWSFVRLADEDLYEIANNAQRIIHDHVLWWSWHEMQLLCHPLPPQVCRTPNKKRHRSAGYEWEKPLPVMTDSELDAVEGSLRPDGELNSRWRRRYWLATRAALHEDGCNIGRHTTDPNFDVHYEYYIQSRTTPTKSGSVEEDRAYAACRKTLTDPAVPHRSVQTLFHPSRCPHGMLHADYCSLCVPKFECVKVRIAGGVERKATRTLATPSEKRLHWTFFDFDHAATERELRHWHARLIIANDSEWTQFCKARLAEFEDWMSEAAWYGPEHEFCYWKRHLEWVWDHDGVIGAKPMVRAELDGHRYTRKACPASEDNSAELNSSDDESFEGFDFGAGPDTHITYQGSRETTEPRVTPEQRSQIVEGLGKRLAAGKLKGKKFQSAATSFDILTGGSITAQIAKRQRKKPNTLTEAASRLKDDKKVP
jgi:hypothetical protein